MPLRNQKPHRWSPAGLTDAVDGSESFAGAMSQLVDLIAQPNTKGIFVPRPAITLLNSILDFGGGPVTAAVSYGNTMYGMAASAAFPGKDRPFVYNATGNVFTANIQGLTLANMPASQPTTGDWTPPTIAYVASRVVFTHPGFPGGTTIQTTFLQFPANTTNGSAVIQGPSVSGSIGFSGLAGITIQGLGIQSGAKFVSAVQNYIATTATGTSGTSSITVASAAGIVLGMAAIGPGMAALVTSIAGTTIGLNGNLTQNLSSTQVGFFGTLITLSLPATATATGVAIYGLSYSALKFGWLDISGFSVNVSGNTINGVPVITGAPNIAGIQPGMIVTDVGSNIPVGTQVVQAANVTFTLTCLVTTGSGHLVVTQGFATSAIAVGQSISGVGIPPNTTVLTFNLLGYTIEMSQAATASSAGGINLTFSGAIIILSQPPVVTITQDNFTIAGGSMASPQWGAGDLDINPLAGTAPAVFVAQFNNRAWFGVNTPTSAGVQASDAGTACVQTNISQTLTFSDGVPVTVASGLALFNQLGGIVQSLMIFQGDSNIRQITGDFSTNTLSVNSLQTATGTLSPNSIAQTPKGLLFMAPDGLRLIDFDARVSDPIGVRGKGIALPFINAVTPSRATAAFNENVYRITVIWQPPPTVQTIWGSAQRIDEFWYHLDLDKWSGPHTSLCDNLAPWPGAGSFVIAPRTVRGTFYRSDPHPLPTSTYIEFGQPLNCVYQTVLLPDNEEQMANFVVESSLFVGLVSGSEEILVTAIDDEGQQLDQTYVWIGPLSKPAQRAIPWHNPMTFRQLMIKVAAGATAQLQLGALNLRHQVLGYQMPYPIPPEFIAGSSIGGGPDVAGP